MTVTFTSDARTPAELRDSLARAIRGMADRETARRTTTLSSMRDINNSAARTSAMVDIADFIQGIALEPAAPTGAATVPRYKLAGAMNGTTLRMIRADLSEGDEIVAVNGGAGCVASFELPHVGMVEARTPSPIGRLAEALCALANAAATTPAPTPWVVVLTDAFTSEHRSYGPFATKPEASAAMWRIVNFQVPLCERDVADVIEWGDRNAGCYLGDGKGGEWLEWFVTDVTPEADAAKG